MGYNQVVKDISYLKLENNSPMDGFLESFENGIIFSVEYTRCFEPDLISMQK